jgi:predicted small lipoprotein YifL
VNRNYRPTSQGWTVILLSAAVLALGGCGRKGPLELPPTASSQQPPAAAHAETEAAQPSQPNLFNPSSGTDAPAATPKGQKKSFILDPLLNNNN